MDVRVYPEYFEGDLLGKDIEIFGKLTTEKFSRMFLNKNGITESFYDKLGRDGKNIGRSDYSLPVTYEIGDVAIGLVCCKDVNEPSIINEVKERLNFSGCGHKVIVISSFMTNDWFKEDFLQPYLHGFTIVLSNGNPDGVSSFIAGPDGKKKSILEMDLGGVRLINCGNL